MLSTGRSMFAFSLRNAAPRHNRLFTGISLLLAACAGSRLTGCTTRGHTGADVPLYAIGVGSDHICGHHDNAWLGQQLLQLVTATSGSHATGSSTSRKEHTP